MILAAASRGDIITVIVGAVVSIVGCYVGLRTYQANRQAGQVSAQVAAQEVSLKSMEAALARNDADRAADRAYFERRMAEMEARRKAEAERCDEKLRALGHIVKQLGGKVPDELNGLNDG